MPRRREIPTLLLAAFAVPAAAPGAQLPTTVSERVEVRLVEVELWASRDGRPLLDLLQSELALTSDGEAVAIGFFTPPEPASETAGAPAAPSSAEPATAAPTTVAVFLDDAHLAPAHRARVVGELAEWLEQRLDPRAAASVVRFGREGEIVAPRNVPRARSVAALRAVAPSGLRALDEALDERSALEQIRERQRRGIASMQQAIARLDRQRAPADGVAQEIFATELPCATDLLRLAEDLADRVERSGRDTLAALAAYASSLAALPGRKVLLFVSDGLSVRPGAAAFDLVRALCDGSGARQGLADAIDVTALPAELQRRPGQLDPATLALAGETRQLANPVAAVAAQANAGGVTIWTLGARGMTTSGVEASAATRDRTFGDELRQRSEAEAALSSLAIDTGGRALLELGDFGAGLDELGDDLRSSYVLAFLAPRAADGKLHQIRVETTRPGVELRYRRVWRDSSGESELAGVAGALVHGVDRPGMRATAVVAQVPGNAGTARTVLRVVVPETALSLLPAEDGRRHGVLRLAIAVRAPGESPSPVRSRLFPIDRPAREAGLRPEPVVHDIELPPLVAGAAVAIGLRDEVDGEIGVLRVEVGKLRAPVRPAFGGGPATVPDSLRRDSRADGRVAGGEATMTIQWKAPGGRAAFVAVACALAFPLAPAGAQDEPAVTPAEQLEVESERSRAEAEPEDPTSAGRDLYFRGAGQLRRAEKLAAKADKATGEAREKLAADARAAYESAAESLAGAVKANPGLRDASASLGAALRALGRAEEAAQVHALALRRDGRDDDNFRGYVESLLALHRLGNVTALHDQLRAEQPKRAELVLDLLRRFRAERARDPGGLAAADLARLSEWLAAHPGS